MARNQSYSLFPRQKLAIFTWHGCTVRVEGDPQVVYISEETPMIMYLNTHIAVDQLRHRREKEGQIGPRVSPPNTHTQSDDSHAFVIFLLSESSTQSCPLSPPAGDVGWSHRRGEEFSL